VNPLRVLLGFWRALVQAFGPSVEPIPPAPAIWPEPPILPPDHIELYRAASRARWLKAASHAAGDRAATAAAEALRIDQTTTQECAFWKYAYEQRTGECAALRTALKTVLAVLPDEQ
jgi:hypothetical protein